MCVSCGCAEPSTDHHDRRHITVEDLQAAADAANTTLGTVAHNIESFAMHHSALAQKTADLTGHNSDGFSPDMTVEQLREHLRDVHRFPGDLSDAGVQRANRSVGLDGATIRHLLDLIHKRDHDREGECGAHEPDVTGRPEPSDSPRIAGVLKASDEDQFLLTVVYSPNRMPLRGADQKTDLASPRVLEKACWMWMAKGAKTGLWHEDGHEHDAVCVENGIYRNPAPWVVKHADGTETVIKEGDWIAGFVLSDRAWKLYKSGRIGGVSMQGGAGRKAPSAETLARVKGGDA